MENASKALIIAGAILLAILIISLGIMIYQQASGVVNNNAMSEVDINSFNQKFIQYTGTNVRGAQVNALLNQIQMSNVTYQDDSSRQVKVTVESSTSWNGTAPSGNLVSTGSYAKANTGATYNVSYKTDSKTGLINEIIIKNAGAGT